MAEGMERAVEEVQDTEGMPSWAPPLFSVLRIFRGGDPAKILVKAGGMADRLAPNIRRTIRYILAFQGVAVLAPLLWFLVVRHRWPAAYVSYAVVFCTLVLIAICWWLRWRGMQYARTGARLVGEIARSGVATKGIAEKATEEALNSEPTLKPLASWIVGENPEEYRLEDARDEYLKRRVDDQLDYYRRMLEEAIVERRRLGRIVTFSLDGSLFLAVAGLAVSFNAGADRWLRLSGSDYILGFVGAALPLVALLMQLLGSSLELDRRTGRYAQQIEFLESVRKKLLALEDRDALRSTVQEVERVLLGEVVEWYYQAKFSEPYYRSKSKINDAAEIREVAARVERSWIERIVSGVGVSAGFVGRVIFGRLLVVALSVVITTGLISLHVPKDPIETSRLRQEDGRLLSSAEAQDWDPVPNRVKNGFLLIAHGLHDGVDTQGKFGEGEEAHWMTRMQEAVKSHLGASAPEICLVNWHLAANPSHFSLTGLEGVKEGDEPGNVIPTTPQGWMQNVAAIRPAAEEIGELVGYKLARAIRSGDIDNTRPMHFVGHSAGGFVVLHAATVLTDLGLAPPEFRVTMLDTPVPVKAHLEHLLKTTPIDFYKTSAFATGIPDSGFVPNFTKFGLELPEGIDPYTGAHSHAHQWYIDSIASGDENGFLRSPLLPPPAAD
ncbi:MAG: hypothetical protein P1U85_14170 [Verrucomicrobiales bacterium]|nr:hypothetical protein [Verrucomicrobiales bacterium]